MTFGNTRWPAGFKAYSQSRQAESADGSNVNGLGRAAGLAGVAAGCEFDEKSGCIPEVFTLQLKAMP